MNAARPGGRWRAVGWLLTPFVVWAAAFLGGWLGASLGGTLGWLIGGAAAGALLAAAGWVLIAVWRRRSPQRTDPTGRTSSER